MVIVGRAKDGYYMILESAYRGSWRRRLLRNEDRRPDGFCRNKAACYPVEDKTNDVIDDADHQL
jgi:hypothetical protein